MNAPVLTFGPTLARQMTPSRARDIVAAAETDHRLKGHIVVSLTTSRHPHRHEVDAIVRGLDPAHALDVLKIAQTRLAAVYALPESNAPAVSPDDEPVLRATAERMVDKFRAVGWWERISGWIGAGATFKYGRDDCVRELMKELALARRPAIEAEAA